MMFYAHDCSCIYTRIYTSANVRSGANCVGEEEIVSIDSFDFLGRRSCDQSGLWGASRLRKGEGDVGGCVCV